MVRLAGGVYADSGSLAATREAPPAAPCGGRAWAARASCCGWRSPCPFAPLYPPRSDLLWPLHERPV